MIIQLIGWIGTLFLIGAGFPQLYKVIREGNAHGMHLWYLLFIWFGLVTMDIYVIFTTFKLQLFASYTIQLIVFSFLLWRKKYPKSIKNET